MSLESTPPLRLLPIKELWIRILAVEKLSAMASWLLLNSNIVETTILILDFVFMTPPAHGLRDLAAVYITEHPLVSS
jgi:hypothetical protein